MDSNPRIGDRQMAGTSGTSEDSPSATAARQARQKANDVVDRGTQAVSDAYTQAAETLNDTVQQAVTYGKQAVSYGRENPGKATLLVFGAGIGIGILIGSSLNSRSKTTRIVSPIMTALTDIATEIFR